MLAAIVGAPRCDANPYDTKTTNVDSVASLVDSISKNQILVYPCTNSGYGIGIEGKHCTEETPLNPISLYGKTKVEAEKYVLQSGNISLRLATVFGASPYMRTDLLVNSFVLKALKDRSIVLFESHFKRNYIHVRDVAQAFLMSLSSCLNCGAFNVGMSDANLSKKELCHKIQEHVDFTIIEQEFQKDLDQRDYIVSNEKIESRGFKPQFTIDDGIVELVKVYTIADDYYL